MSKRILAVGLSLASDFIAHENFREKASLLDWDIVLFRPQFEEFDAFREEQFQGKPSYSDSGSFQLRECCSHWRREIKEAFDAGKTVVVFLPELEQIYVDTGKRDYSGTGRNRQTTRIVDSYDNYQAIPTELEPAAVKGVGMKLATGANDVLGAYWKDFGARSSYNVVLRAKDIPAALLTKSGERVVGAIYRSKVSTGALVLLPALDFDADEFFSSDLEWTDDARRFSAQLLTAIVGMDKAIRSTSDVTPEPAWASSEKFHLPQESELRARLALAETELEAAQRKKEAVEEELVVAGEFRRLLFEKGSALESSIISALRLLGFSAEGYRDSNSEFDVVFESEEGRLIGEAEGKDSKAVNVDKLRQLAMNINEDLLREEVDRPAKPVLFGNGYRLTPIEDRSDPFTEKCRAAATQSSTALVATQDLFAPVQYLLANHDDDGYRRDCRLAILTATGRAVFPAVPNV